MINYNLNRFVLRDNFVEGEVWIPKEKFEKVRSQLRGLGKEFHDATFHDGEEAKETVPTYFRSNEFIFPFQEIVNTYGVPRYQEANPALFTIVTFPFLFGVMFGDIGHGLLLLLFASYLCFNRDELIANNSALKPAIKARYLLLLMGFFAFFAGWMYNDFLSIPINIFGTCYINKGEVAVKNFKECVYPFGMDPKWYVASNELSFFNSLKMKMSVILGVTQMLAGIVLRGMNAVYFNNYVDFIFEFVPQLIFMTLLFGYMNIMIFIKWGTDWSQDPSKAPSIITLLMNIFLKGGSVDNKPVVGSTEFQESMNFYFLIICLICIPLILIPKPILTFRKISKENAEKHKHSHEHYQPLDGKEDQQRVIKSHDEHDESIADLFVHQSIETIEFVLGSISNTASYLRLWALSLAHAQLAKVFFEKSLLGFIQEGNLLLVIIGFFIFTNITFAVLMCMDLMECFLHTLRLHWVEFQNKFYKADGVRFNPYSFKIIVETD